MGHPSTEVGPTYPVCEALVRVRDAPPTFRGIQVPACPKVLHGPTFSSFESCVGACMRGSGEEPAAPSVVTGVPIILDIECIGAGETTITGFVGEAPRTDWIFPDPNSQVPLKPNEGDAHSTAIWGMRFLLHKEISHEVTMGDDLGVID